VHTNIEFLYIARTENLTAFVSSDSFEVISFSFCSLAYKFKHNLHIVNYTWLWNNDNATNSSC